MSMNNNQPVPAVLPDTAGVELSENEDQIPVYHLVAAEPTKNNKDNDSDNDSEDDGCLWHLARRVLDRTEDLRKASLYSVLVSLLAMFVVGVVIVILDENAFPDRWKALVRNGFVLFYYRFGSAAILTPDSLFQLFNTRGPVEPLQLVRTYNIYTAIST